LQSELEISLRLCELEDSNRARVWLLSEKRRLVEKPATIGGFYTLAASCQKIAVNKVLFIHLAGSPFTIQSLVIDITLWLIWADKMASRAKYCLLPRR
jgi:hypothetical protein